MYDKIHYKLEKKKKNERRGGDGNLQQDNSREIVWDLSGLVKVFILSVIRSQWKVLDRGGIWFLQYFNGMN